MAQSRRVFLKNSMGGTLVLVSSLSGFLASCSSLKSQSWDELTFRPISPSYDDELKLVEGLHYDVLISENDMLTSDGQLFGSNNDYTAFHPISKTEGILWVNHEYSQTLFISGWARGDKIKTKKMVDLERKSVGGSLVHLIKENDKWSVVKKSKLNRRITGETPIPIIASRDIAGSKMAIGTLANCAGGMTPWGTFLSCEENYDNFYGEREHREKDISKTNLGWDKFYPMPPEHYGWVVEIEPLTGEAKKLTSIGRFSHECATCVRTNSGHVAVYSGDDRADEFIYKFISKRKNDIEEGTLYVANIEKGKWLSLDINESKILKDNFDDQLDVLIHCRKAARLLGATPCDRPEDIEVHPETKEVFVTLTNNKKNKNYYGKILKIKEDGNDHGSLTFYAEDFLVGGDDLACPDNLAFDHRGNLWVTTDISGRAIGTKTYEKFKNNGLFFVPTSGNLKSKAFQVASAPVDAELTGITFMPDQETIILSVQHPGEMSKQVDKPTSRWPKGGNTVPRSSVVQIKGPALEKIWSKKI